MFLGPFALKSNQTVEYRSPLHLYTENLKASTVCGNSILEPYIFRSLVSET
jgi:hypothetical protein